MTKARVAGVGMMRIFGMGTVLVVLNACTANSVAPDTADKPTDNIASFDIAQRLDCSALTGMKVPAADIGPPTTGALISAAEKIPEATIKEQIVAEHCLVSGEIKPLDPSAPNIRFQIALPVMWNSKALMLGGGGFEGIVPQVTGNINNTSANSIAPLNRGYAVFGGDSGHIAPDKDPASYMTSEQGSFMTNEESWINYRGDALKKTHDAVMAVIFSAYGQSPSQTYFIGGSASGREALVVAGRWPEDWDGVISLFPALHLVTSVLGVQHMNRALAKPGAWLNPSERGALFQAAQSACDSLDGADDGVISNIKGCYASFEPRTALLDGVALRCPKGEDTADTCLSDAQLEALETLNNPFKFGFPLASGDTHYPGFYAYTSDWGIPGDTQMHQINSWLGFGTIPPAFPTAQGMTLHVSYADNFFRYGVANGDLAFNTLEIDPTKPSPYAERLSEMSTPESADKDLTQFANKGGKLIIIQGTADTITSPKLTEEYYEGLKETMGHKLVNKSVRFYEIHGWSHSLSTHYYAQWDYLSALENWVEADIDPAENEVVMDGIGVPGRTRPLCMYPRWPHFDKTGDINKAASFTCKDPW